MFFTLARVLSIGGDTVLAARSVFYADEEEEEENCSEKPILKRETMFFNSRVNKENHRHLVCVDNSLVP
jgi:hypothetical protein